MVTDQNFVKTTLEKELQSTRVFLAEIKRRIVLDSVLIEDPHDEQVMRHRRWLAEETEKEAKLVAALEKLEREAVA